jgi:hypothetical protein
MIGSKHSAKFGSLVYGEFLLSDEMELLGVASYKVYRWALAQASLGEEFSQAAGEIRR